MGNHLQPARRRLLIVCFALALVAVALGRSASAQSAEARKEALNHFKQAEAYMKAGAYSEAVAEYQAAYQAVAKPGFLFNIGLAYEAAGDQVKAVEHFRRYLALEPNGRASVEARARAAKLEKEIEAAAQAAAEAERKRLETEQHRKSAQAHAQAAEQHRAAARYPEAVAELQTAFADQPDPEYVFALADVFRQAGELPKAIVEYERYRELAPTGAHGARALERITELKRQLEEAARPTPEKPPPQEIVVKLPEQPVVTKPDKKKGGVKWGWIAVGVAALAAGLVADLGPSKAHNGELDALDFAPLPLYGLTGVCAIVVVF